MRSATSVAGRYKRANLSAIRFRGVLASDRRYGPQAWRATLTTRSRLQRWSADSTAILSHIFAELDAASPARDPPQRPSRLLLPGGTSGALHQLVAEPRARLDIQGRRRGPTWSTVRWSA